MLSSSSALLQVSRTVASPTASADSVVGRLGLSEAVGAGLSAGDALLSLRGRDGCGAGVELEGGRLGVEGAAGGEGRGDGAGLGAGGFFTVTVRVAELVPAPFEQVSRYVRVLAVRASPERFSLPLADFLPLQLPEATQLDGLLDTDQLSLSEAPRVSVILPLVLFARRVTEGGFMTVTDLPVQGVRIYPFMTTAIPQLKLYVPGLVGAFMDRLKVAISPGLAGLLKRIPDAFQVRLPS